MYHYFCTYSIELDPLDINRGRRVLIRMINSDFYNVNSQYALYVDIVITIWSFLVPYIFQQSIKKKKKKQWRYAYMFLWLIQNAYVRLLMIFDLLYEKKNKGESSRPELVLIRRGSRLSFGILRSCDFIFFLSSSSSSFVRSFLFLFFF